MSLRPLFSIIEQYVSMIGEKVGLKYGAEAVFIPYNLYEENKVDEIKQLLLARLKERNWVSEESS